MEKRKKSVYEVLVYVAYGYYILIGLTFLVSGLMWGGHFNNEAFFVIALMGIQAYYMNKIINLILGIIILGISIYWSLEFMLLAGKTGYDVFVEVMLGLTAVSLIMSVILIFSYAKLSFKEQ